MSDIAVGRNSGRDSKQDAGNHTVPVQDILAVGGVTAMAFGLVHATGVADAIFESAFWQGIAAEAVLTVFAALLMLVWFAGRRWFDTRAEAARCRRTEAELARSLLRTETERALRIGRRPAWRLDLAGTDGCERNITEVAGAIASLRDLILRGHLGADVATVREVEALTEYLVHSLTTSMRENCTQCRTAAASAEGQAAVVHPPFRRERLLLRLLTAKVAPLFAPGAPGERVVPRQFTVGFDLYLHQVFGDSLYALLNQEARDIMNAIHADADHEVWTNLMSERRYRNFGLRLLVRLCAAFADFERGRTHLTTAVAKHLRSSDPTEGRADAFVDADFAVVFSALFGDLFEFVGQEENRIWLDYICGPGTADAVRATHLEFSNRVVAALPREVAPDLPLVKIA